MATTILGEVTAPRRDRIGSIDGGVEHGARNPAIRASQLVQEFFDLNGGQLRQHRDDLAFGEPDPIFQYRDLIADDEGEGAPHALVEQFAEVDLDDELKGNTLCEEFRDAVGSTDGTSSRWVKEMTPVILQTMVLMAAIIYLEGAWLYGLR